MSKVTLGNETMECATCGDPAPFNVLVGAPKCSVCDLLDEDDLDARSLAWYVQSQRERKAAP